MCIKDIGNIISVLCSFSDIQLGAGQRQLIDQYSLKRRYYIGNTSMDAQLSLIMANMAQVGKCIC